MKWNFINLTEFKQFNWIGSIACSADEKMSKNRYIPEFFLKKSKTGCRGVQNVESSFESEIICEIDQNGAGWSNKQKDSTSTSSIFHWLMNKQKTNKSSGHEHFFILFFSPEAENESSSSEVEKQKNDQLDLFFSRGQVHDFMQPIFSNEKKKFNSLFVYFARLCLQNLPKFLKKFKFFF